MKFVFVFIGLIFFYVSDGQLTNQIPVLCYHNIRTHPVREDELTISETRLDSQLSYLKNSGYQTISPEQLYNHFKYDSVIPQRSFLITFDDTHKEHYLIAQPLLDKYGFKAVFFIMTICIDKPNYLTTSQIKELSVRGHIIGAHTWDHPNLAKKDSIQWNLEIEKPIFQLEKITGKKVETFAYPYGAWSEKAITELKDHHIKTAFQLLGKQNKNDPLMTLNRLMVSGKWSGTELLKIMNTKFTFRNF
jgi:peptidoglycan/xylan/chitin deacetylase (PgdA/CDA1 family)